MTEEARVPLSSTDFAPPPAGEVWAVVRRLRRARQRRAIGGYAYIAYVVILGLVIYAGQPLSNAIGAAIGKASALPSRPLPGVALNLLTVAFALVLLGTARAAAWRGPVSLSPPDVTWLLPMPVDRTPLLRGRARLMLVFGATVGLLIGGIGAAFLYDFTGGRPGPLVGAGAVAGVLFGMLTVEVGAVAQRRARLSRLAVAGTPVAVAVAVAVAALGWWLPASSRIVEWTGPWGWAALLFGRTAHQVAAPELLALAFLAALAVAGALMAVRDAGAVPTARLRESAAVSAEVGAALMTGELRDAALRIRTVRRRRRVRVTLPPPRRSWLVVPWRDALALLRQPTAAATGVLLGCVAAIVAVAAPGSSSRVGLALAAAACGYAAAVRLVEPARLDADDPRRSGGLPYSYDRLAFRHAALPVAVLLAVGLPAAGITAAVRGLDVASALVGVVAVTPVLVGAALTGAYRGRAPLWLAFSGGDVGGYGAPGAPLLVLWYTAPLLIGLAAVAYAVLAPANGSLDVALFAAAVTGLGGWLRRRARKLLRSTR